LIIVTVLAVKTRSGVLIERGRGIYRKRGCNINGYRMKKEKEVSE
jgi:hypothetical protein